ncbi:hypothetical protein B0H16DRAFT_1489486 [Mycena metata]|uniref:Pentatricopeptide repeat-containing protein n=1 Tax=Mycena metata TaxID=1033252 RepID=A0AAD7P3F7_9AGAR|nr:hypothetical protein B0H16DRAFT_1489486 [Mycena metata]
MLRFAVRAPAQFVRAASFPPRVPKHQSLPEPDGTIDPTLFHQLHKTIRERHNPSTIDLDEPQLKAVNTSIFNITHGLKHKDIALIHQSWAELRRTNHLHTLSTRIVQDICRLATASIPSSIDDAWDSDRRSFVEDVAFAALSHSTAALNACVLAYLRRGDSKAVLELHEKFQRLPGTQSVPLSDPDHATKAKPKPPESMLLAVVAAYAMEDSFQGVLKTAIALDFPFPHQLSPDFLKIISYDPALQAKVEIYLQRLDLAKIVGRPRFFSKYVDNLPSSQASTIEKHYNSILEAMSGSDAWIVADPELITPTKPIAMSELGWGTFLAAFLRWDRNNLAAKLWKDMTQLGIRPGIVIWNMVIKVYKDRAGTDELLGAWGTMTAQGVKPDGYTYSLLIASLFAAKRTHEAIQWFRTFEKDESHIPAEQSLAVHNAALSALFRLGRENAQVAFMILQKMQKKGPKPDLISYNTVVGYHAHQSDFKAMAATITQMSAAGIAGDVFTFSTILSALLKVGRGDAPEMVMGIMRKQGVNPSVATYSDIITFQMREQTVPHLQAAMSLLDEMEKDPNVSPNAITYTSVLGGLYRGSWLTADQIKLYKQDILTRMKNNGIQLKEAGYNILLKACLTSEAPIGVEEALGYYRQMIRANVPRKDDTWYILLAGLIERGEWRIAHEIVQDMAAIEFQPNRSVLRLAHKIRQHIQ